MPDGERETLIMDSEELVVAPYARASKGGLGVFRFAARHARLRLVSGTRARRVAGNVSRTHQQSVTSAASGPLSAQ